jgi:predicted GTPase
MLRLAVGAGYPSIRQFLAGTSATEHRELLYMLDVEPVGDERMDWHFARLYSILVTLLGSSKASDNAPTLTEWLLERLIMPKTEAEEQEEEEMIRSNFAAFMRGLAAKTGATLEAVPDYVPTLAELEQTDANAEAGDAS